MLRFLPHESPSRYFFIDPDTGREYHGADKRSLFFQILNYREQNNLPTIEQLNDVIENYLCGLPENAGKCFDYVLTRGFTSYVKGGIALIENLFFGEKNMVTDADAEQRARTCAICPQNVFPDKDAFVEWSDNIAVNSTGGRKTESYEKLGNCGCCSCPLRAKVFKKGPFKLTKKELGCLGELPFKCWQLDDYIEHNPNE